MAAAVGAAGAVGIGGSSPTGNRLSPSAVRWGNGGGVVLSTGSVAGGPVVTWGGGGGLATDAVASAGSWQGQPMSPGLNQHVGFPGDCSVRESSISTV